MILIFQDAVEKTQIGKLKKAQHHPPKSALVTIDGIKYRVHELDFHYYDEEEIKVYIDLDFD